MFWGLVLYQLKYSLVVSLGQNTEGTTEKKMGVLYVGQSLRNPDRAHTGLDRAHTGSWNVDTKYTEPLYYSEKGYFFFLM